MLQVKGGVELTVGYHQLSGKLVPLKKPLAVLEKAAVSNHDLNSGTQYQVGCASEGGRNSTLQLSLLCAQRSAASEVYLEHIKMYFSIRQCPKCPRMQAVHAIAGRSCVFQTTDTATAFIKVCVGAMRQVIGVVRQKCLFKTRPKALITKPTERGGPVTKGI